MKRAISMLLVVTMLMTLMSGMVFAAETDTLVITGDSTAVQPGETANIPLTVEQNPGFQGMSLYPVITDSDGEKVTWEWYPDDYETELKKASGRGAFFSMEYAAQIVLTADTNCTATGKLMDVFFTVPADAAPGDYTVSFRLFNNECFNENSQTVPVELPAVTVTVQSTCDHAETKVENAKNATCTAEGYTGDTICVLCQEMISAGQTIPALDHADKNCDFVCDRDGCGYVFSVSDDTLYISGQDVTVFFGNETMISLIVEQNPAFAGMTFAPIITDAEGNRVDWEWIPDDYETELKKATGRGAFFTLEYALQIVLTADKNCTATGKLIDVFVAVPADAAPGEYTVTFHLDQCTRIADDSDPNSKLEDIACILPTVTITVECPHENATEVGRLPSTCMDEGYITYYCARCDQNYDESIPLEEHKDEDLDHYCDYGCNKYFSVHEDNDLNHTCDYGCSEPIGEHADSADDQDHVCDYGCNEVLEACSDVEGDENHSCDICGEENVTEHNYKPADCLHPATCMECGVTEGGLGDHSYDVEILVAPNASNMGVVNAQCAVCGEKVVVKLPAFNTADYTYEVIQEPTEYTDGIGRYTWNETTYGSFGFNVVIRHEVAETDAQLVVESKIAKAGDTIRMEVVLNHNPGIAGILGYLQYDKSVMTLVNVENGSVLTDLEWAKSMVWLADKNSFENGVLCVLEFQIAEDVIAGSYPVQLVLAEVLNEDCEAVQLHTVFAEVSVRNVVYGDADGDGEVTLKDAVLLRRYFAYKDVTTGESDVVLEPGADADGDGEITLKDAVLLRRYFAYKDFTTGESSVVLGPR